MFANPTSRHRERCIAHWCLALFLLVIPACTRAGLGTSSMLERLTGDTSKKRKAEMPPAGPTKVIADATELALDRPESDLESRGKFKQRFDALIDEGRMVAATYLVARFSEHAYESLASQRPGEVTSSELASAYDRFCGARDGWFVVANSPTADEGLRKYRQARAYWMANISSGRFSETAEGELVELAEESKFKVLVLDAWYQTGIGHLLRGENEQAAQCFANCSQLAGEDAGMMGPNAELLRSEAHRRAQQFGESNSAWLRSVEFASQLLANCGVSDPTYWERALYLKPVGTAWPNAVAVNFQRFAEGPNRILRVDLLRQLTLANSSAAPVTAACWIESAIGAWQHQRGESHKAILRFKKAENYAKGPATDWLRIAQARELTVLGQSGTALALLSQVVAKEDHPPEKLAAMSEVGVYRLTGGDMQSGVQLLGQVVESHPSVQWPGRAGVEADYALGLLMLGEKGKGQQQLDLAQRRFQSEGELELLAKSLWNEMKYLEHIDAEKNQIKAVKQQLNDLRL